MRIIEAGYGAGHADGEVAWDRLVSPAVAGARDGVPLAPGRARARGGAGGRAPMEPDAAGGAAVAKKGAPYHAGAGV
jgi:hypothetical protein